VTVWQRVKSLTPNSDSLSAVALIDTVSLPPLQVRRNTRSGQQHGGDDRRDDQASA
jgi:hypothetical protein